MEAMVQEWSDGRLDDLNGKVGRGFAQVETEFQSSRLEMRTEFTAVRAEMEEMRRGIRAEIGGVRSEMNGMRSEMNAIRESIGGVQRSIAWGAVSLTAAILAGFAGMCTLIAATL
jgi:hypothetical protein